MLILQVPQGGVDAFGACWALFQGSTYKPEAVFPRGYHRVLLHAQREESSLSLPSLREDTHHCRKVHAGLSPLSTIKLGQDSCKKLLPAFGFGAGKGSWGKESVMWAFCAKSGKSFFLHLTDIIASVHHFLSLFDVFKDGGIFGMYSHLDLSPL